MIVESRFEKMLLEYIHANDFAIGKKSVLPHHHPLRTTGSYTLSHADEQAQHEGKALSKATGIDFETNRVGFKGEAMTLHHAVIPNSSHTLVVKKHANGTHSYGTYSPESGFKGLHNSTDSLSEIHDNLKKLHSAGEYAHAIRL